MTFPIIKWVRIKIFNIKEDPANISSIKISNLPFVLFFNLIFLTVLIFKNSEFLPQADSFQWFIFILLADIDILTDTLPFELLGLLFVSCLFYASENIFWINRIIGFIFIFLLLYFIYIFGKKHYSEKIIPFGFGDVLFGSMIGLFLGWYAGLYAISIGLIISGIFAETLVIAGHKKDTAFPFAPFLLIGAQVGQIF